MKPFLEGKSERTKEYYRLHCEVMRHRIKTRLRETSTRGYEIEDKMDTLWEESSEEELAEIEALPRMWWFQQLDADGLGTSKSELDVYPFAKYFVNQEPHLLGEDVSIMKGSPYFGDKKYHPHHAVLFFMIDDGKDLTMKTMTNKDYKELQDNYDFVRYSGKFPVFIKRL